ncbi:MAG: DUF3267 domain-containing protein [Acutalibacteraceae bacterium]
MSSKKLPSEYEQIKVVNLINDKKAACIVNVLSFVTIVIMLLLGGLFYGSQKLENLLLIDNRRDLLIFICKVLLIIVLCAVYVVLHEFIHSAFMRLFCKNSKISFGYRFFYAYASSDGYYDKRAYNIIAVAPLFLFGVLLSILCAVAPNNWFWTFYIVQIFNFSVAAGDIYIFFFISRMPKDILVKDNGTEIIIYGK